VQRRRAKLVLGGASFLLALLVGEGVARLAGGYRLGSLRLATAVAAPTDPAAVLSLVPDVVEPFAARWASQRPDLDIAWLRTSPPPLPRQRDLGLPLLPQHDWRLHYYANNAVLLRAMWVKGHGLPILAGLRLPDEFVVFDPPGGRPHPGYRYPASTTLPTGLTTNQFGFRGRELAAQKPAGTVRIGFLGASTTVEAHGLPHSAPELVEHWLNLWAEQNQLALRFETLNAAREAIQSPDLLAIVEDELLPLDLDYLVYYEGANQLQPHTMQKHVQVEGEYALASPPPGLVGAYDETATADSSWLDGLATHVAIARYLRGALQRGKRLAEPAKPTQRITLPDSLWQGDFDLAAAAGLLELDAIGRDLEAIHRAAQGRGVRLLPSTFWWLAADGLQLDAVMGHNVHVHLNRAFWPFRYDTVRRLADLQNRFFAAWAKAHGLDCLATATELPHDPALAIDAIHHNEVGVRLKAWVWFAGLARVIARDLDQGQLPRPAAAAPPWRAVPTRRVTPAELDR
jgi:hypothetical protein